ncbi:MAG TPA: hypothetical protein VM533_05485 [Fimbriiglobus sp.]|nr:hypothetical protein [Fimbriiglobus sp.]
MSRRAMKPSYLLTAVLLLAGWNALAQSPAPKSKPAVGGKPMVLLLDNFQVVDGTVERVGDAYRLRRGKDVKDYPSKQVLFAGESREEVYKLMLARGLKPPAPPPAAADCNSAAFRAFPAKVQPLLMNLCADCHAKPDHPSEFKITRVPAGYANPEASQRNAKDVAKFVSRDDPSASPLLSKAVSAHGGQRTPALFNRSHPAYRNLELWVHWAAGPEGSPAPEAIPARKPHPTATSAAVRPLPAAAGPPAKPDDPYDPAVFNQAVHPMR